MKNGNYILNLPDTIQFFSGAQIINTYDAARVKRRTCYRTPMEPELTPIGIVHHYPNESNDMDKTIITYNGSFVRTTMLSEGTAYRHDLSVHNPEGYTHFDITDGKFTNPQQYYFRRDHLGSNMAVWNATRDTTVQRTWYYASGTPMPNSTGQSAQSYKYNGKEFVEIFGNSKYDVIARQYDPIVVRTTTMDPHCENDYSTSPYAWCGNSFVNTIDPMGRDTAYFDSEGQYQYTIAADGEHIGILSLEEGQVQFSFVYQDDINRLYVENSDEAYEEGSLIGIKIVSMSDILEIVKDATNNVSFSLLYALKESRGGKLDFVGSGHPYIQNNAKYLFFPQDGNFVVHDSWNFGNYLWGKCMSEMGINFNVAILSSHIHSLLFNHQIDSKDDQLSIKYGYYAK